MYFLYIATKPGLLLCALFPFLVDHGVQKFSCAFKLKAIDGTKAQLYDSKGFRNLVRQKAVALGLTGDICRAPTHDANVSIHGTRDQLQGFSIFLGDLQAGNYIKSVQITVDVKPGSMFIPTSFQILHSTRKHVQTGNFSDPKLDADVVSVSSSDKEYARGAPSPHDSRRSGSDR